MRVAVGLLLAAGCTDALRGLPPAWHARPAPTMTVMDAAFVPAALEPSETALLPEWFEQWGFASPGPPQKKGGGKKGAKGKGKAKPRPAAKAGGFGVGGGGAATDAARAFVCSSPPEEILTVVRARREEGTELSAEELASWGAAARRTIEELLPRTGAVLLRNLPMRSPEAFGHFWKGCLLAPPALEEGSYLSLGGTSRTKMSGIDLATNVPPEFLLLNHNELCYNPRTVERIALYCVQDAPVGGESTLARNRDLMKTLPAEVPRFLAEHGGILYAREFYDARRPPVLVPGAPPPAATGSWQEKCGLPLDAERAQAEEFFLAMGFDSSQIEWDESGSLRVTNQHPGFVKDPESGEDVWWNIVHTGSIKTADGTPIPKKLVAEVQRSAWDHTYAFKLRPGDWLMLDNMRVQHGRLPFFDHERQRRCLLTVYTTPRCAITE